MNKKIFKRFLNAFKKKVKKFTDKRKGKNISISIEDIVLSAFSMFFMQVK